jgi:hypothetical protein
VLGSTTSVLSTLSAFTRDLSGVMGDDLRREGIKHGCGRPYEVRWIDRDGEVLIWDASKDAYEAVLTATCPDCIHGPRSDGSYHYMRVCISGWAMGRAVNLAGMFGTEIRLAFEKLKKHLRTYMTEIDPPAFAEWITLLLSKRGSMTLHDAETHAKHERVPWDAQEALLACRRLGFIKSWGQPLWKHTRAPVSWISEPQAPLTAMPHPEIVENPILALPQEHPLALAA